MSASMFLEGYVPTVGRLWRQFVFYCCWDVFSFSRHNWHPPGQPAFFFISSAREYLLAVYSNESAIIIIVVSPRVFFFNTPSCGRCFFLYHNKQAPFVCMHVSKLSVLSRNNDHSGLVYYCGCCWSLLRYLIRRLSTTFTSRNTD